MCKEFFFHFFEDEHWTRNPRSPVTCSLTPSWCAVSPLWMLTAVEPWDPQSRYCLALPQALTAWFTIFEPLLQAIKREKEKQKKKILVLFQIKSEELWGPYCNNSLCILYSNRKFRLLLSGVEGKQIFFLGLWKCPPWQAWICKKTRLSQTVHVNHTALIVENNSF